MNSALHTVKIQGKQFVILVDAFTVVPSEQRYNRFLVMVEGVAVSDCPSKRQANFAGRDYLEGRAHAYSYHDEHIMEITSVETVAAEPAAEPTYDDFLAMLFPDQPQAGA